jgi:hypothetical protein
VRLFFKIPERSGSRDKISHAISAFDFEWVYIGLSRFDVNRRPGGGRGPVKIRNYPGSRPPPGRRGLSAKLLFLTH